MQQVQAETVLARELAAGAGAFEGRFAEVDLGTVREPAAALAFAPHRIGIQAERTPLGGSGKLRPCFCRCGIRSKRKDLFGFQHEVRGTNRRMSGRVKLHYRILSKEYPLF